MKLVLQIAAGILVAAILLFAAKLYMAKVAMDAMAASAQVALTTLQKTAEAQSERMRARQAERVAQSEHQKMELQRQKAAQMRAESDALAARIQTEQAREAAWNRFYQPSASCLNPPTWEAQVECGNAHIRAKREFEIRWEQGRLP